MAGAVRARLEVVGTSAAIAGRMGARQGSGHWGGAHGGRAEEEDAVRRVRPFRRPLGLSRTTREASPRQTRAPRRGNDEALHVRASVSTRLVFIGTFATCCSSVNLGQARAAYEKRKVVLVPPVLVKVIVLGSPSSYKTTEVCRSRSACDLSWRGIQSHCRHPIRRGVVEVVDRIGSRVRLDHLHGGGGGAPSLLPRRPRPHSRRHLRSPERTTVSAIATPVPRSTRPWKGIIRGRADSPSWAYSTPPPIPRPW